MKELYSIPDFFEKRDITLKLIKIWKEHPEYFRDDIVIDNVYGIIPCKFNGGRPFPVNESIDPSEYTKPFYDLGMNLRFTITNSLIDESNVYDEYSNRILSENNIIGNSVNVYSDYMMNYIENKYKNYYGLWSITRWDSDIDIINKKSKDHLLVLPYNLNRKLEILDNLRYPENIEILLIDSCPYDCPKRKEHYEMMSEFNLGYINSVPTCILSDNEKNDVEINHKLKPIEVNEIKQLYLDRGINKFKIVGRGWTSKTVISLIINYISKDQYVDKLLKLFDEY